MDGDEDRVAVVVGATGLVGRELVRALNNSPDWRLVYGVARNNPPAEEEEEEGTTKYRFVGCDLLNRRETMEKLRPLGATHLFWVTWGSDSPLDTEECCNQNRAMLSNALDAIPTPAAAAGGSIRHVSLQTGTKHYVSLAVPSSPSSYSCHHEESPRVAGAPNFYYALEDVVSERQLLIRSWSVHRPGLLLGLSRRSLFNVVGSLCVYAAICSHLRLPFLFGGHRRCWEEPYMDASDARLIARQHIWSATSGLRAAGGQAFNAANVDPFTWKEVWPVLASCFGLPLPVEEGVFLAEGLSYGEAMADKAEVWEEIVAKEGLRRTRVEELANWWFLDAMFRYPVEKGRLLVQRPTRAQRLGFTPTYSATESFLYWVDRMRKERLIPPSRPTAPPPPPPAGRDCHGHKGVSPRSKQ